MTSDSLLSLYLVRYQVLLWVEARKKQETPWLLLPVWERGEEQQQIIITNYTFGIRFPFMTWNEGAEIRRNIGFVFILLTSIYRVSSLSNGSSFRNNRNDAVVLIAKTKETFKLADLQYLEATVQSESKYDCKRLLMDAATGSSLFLVDRLASDFEACIFGQKDDSSQYVPSSLRACEWVGEVICNSPSPEELLYDLSSMKTTTRNLGAWTLEYLRMKSGSRNEKSKTYTQKTLCCCISQKLSGTAALNPCHAVDKLLVVDTCESVFLVKLLHLPSDETSSLPSSPSILTQQKWAQRPFPYSSATNFQAAEMAMNLLSHRVALRPVNEQPTKPHLLDATCGSGTFLALAMARGMQVTGWDFNLRCVEGTQRNLQYAFGNTNFTVLQRSCLDVPENMTQAGVGKIDAVACNLPWGLNSNLFADDGDNCSSRLFSAIRKVLKPGIPCVFLYKEEGESGTLYWEQLGYKVIGYASIPQKNYVLPKERKKEKRRPEENVLNGRSSCIVSLVETI